LPRIEWGNAHSSFSLETDSESVADIARTVFEPWQVLGSPRHFGPWRVVQAGPFWRVESPADTQLLIEKFELPSEYSTPEEALKAVEFRAVGASILLPGAPLGFHGALLSKGSGAIGVIGGKEAGKSTLAAALWHAGFRLQCDDGFQLDEELKASPVTRRSRLRGSSRELFSQDVWQAMCERSGSFLESDGGVLFHPQLRQPENRPLKALILLRAEPGELELLEESAGVLECVVHTHTYHVDGLGKAIAGLADLSNKIKCFKLGRGSLPSRIAQIETLDL
jgi:hypothetical protein